MKKAIITIRKSHYTSKDRQGEEFISLGIDLGLSGTGSPCDSKEDVLQTARNYLETVKDEFKGIELINETDLDFSIVDFEFKGQQKLFAR